jgi:hypothetical protein
MLRIQEIRQSIDHRLDSWEKNALALEAQLDANRQAVLDRIEGQKQRTREALDRTGDALNGVVGLADDAKSKILANLDHLKVQLALGKMDTRQTYEEQKKKISSAVAQLEASLDARATEADRELDEAIDEWVDEVIVLEAEISAAEVQWVIEQAEKRQEWETKKQAIRDGIDTFRRELDENRAAGQEKLEAFANQAGSGFEQIRDAFKNLTS